MDYTRQFLGATSAALGETRPDNTSAIIALQRAASIPSEITKQNLYKSIEDLGRIYLDFMAAYYGKRKVQVSMPDVGSDILAFAGKDPEELETVLFDYGILNDMPMALKLDVGASSYWSEMASVQTLDNLLMQDKITIEEYLERIPDGYIPKRQELIASRKQAAQQQMMQPEEQSTGGTPETGALGRSRPEDAHSRRRRLWRPAAQGHADRNCRITNARRKTALQIHYRINFSTWRQP